MQSPLVDMIQCNLCKSEFLNHTNINHWQL